MTHISEFMNAVTHVISQLNDDRINEFVKALVSLRERRGRLFVLGVGGSAANAQHVVSDLRKLARIEAYSFDNLAELTARVNDSETGWEFIFSDWLEVNNLIKEDSLLILSVGGGTNFVSANICNAIDYAIDKNSRIYSIVGKPDGYAAKYSYTAVIIPENKYTTPICEAMQMVIMHCIVSHPKLQVNEFKWK